MYKQYSEICSSSREESITWPSDAGARVEDQEDRQDTRTVSAEACLDPTAEPLLAWCSVLAADPVSSKFGPLWRRNLPPLASETHIR